MSHAGPISIYLVDDDLLVCAGLRALLERDPRFAVVGEHDDARAAIRAIRELQPDVVILDITMPGLSGIDAVGPVKEVSPRTRVLMASQHQGAHFVQMALRAGADGYVAKSSKPEELAVAIEAVLGGQPYVSPTVGGGLDGRLPGDRGDLTIRSPLDALTDREREVFQLLAVGKANKQIASMLHVTLSTVKKHRENLQRKLDCHSAAELARLAIREGLVTS